MTANTSIKEINITHFRKKGFEEISLFGQSKSTSMEMNLGYKYFLRNLLVDNSSSCFSPLIQWNCTPVSLNFLLDNILSLRDPLQHERGVLGQVPERDVL